MSYKITGIGNGSVDTFKSTLEDAARAASKMLDQGAESVRVYNPAGAEISQGEWEAAWWQSAERNQDPPQV
ncbi:MAG: hypothetical protein ABIO43_07800 [Sphingomicrobium sp.]